MFQSRVNQQLPIGVAGDFASVNPRASVLGGEAAFKVAASQSVKVGYFAWVADDGLVYSSQAAAAAVGGERLGFVARQANEPSVVITTFLDEASMQLNDGLPCTLFDYGDFLADFAAGAATGAAVYATAASGQPTTNAAAGANPDTGYKVVTPAKAPAVTDAATVIALNTGVMTVAVVASGTIEVGQQVTGTGVPANTFITAQLSGTAGGAGTYQTTSVNRAAVAAFTATMVQATLARISRNYTAG